MRALGMLPERTTDRVWVPDPADIQPAFGLLCQIDPRTPFAAGKASLSAYNPQWFSTSAGAQPEVSIRSNRADRAASSISTSPVLALAANVWRGVDMVVYSSPAGAPSPRRHRQPVPVVVTSASTGGKRVSVPLAMTASSDGTAFAYFVPTLTGHGGAWYGTTVYGL
jgi:hypothetical protein